MGDTRRWTATYTKHMRQKRKVYQDGVLELQCACHKVILYDDSGKLLDSRFLKKDEVVESGGTLEFDTHLVDVGDPEENYKPLVDLNVRLRESKSIATNTIQRHKATYDSCTENNKMVLQKVGAIYNHPNAVQGTIKEWHALYSKQLTQKAKKYNDGILKLEACGSYRKQVILLDEGGTILSSKYLKLSEDLNAGSSFELPNYLVEIGELRTSLGGKLKQNASSGKVMVSNSSGANADKCAFGGRVIRKQLLRDAHQILSVLKRPVAQETLAPNVLPVEQNRTSESLDLSQTALLGKQLEPDIMRKNYSGNNSEALNGDASKNFDQGCITETAMRTDLLSEYKADPETPKVASTDSKDLYLGNRGRLPSDNSDVESKACPRAAESDISRPASGVECNEKSFTEFTANTDHQISDIITCNSAENRLSLAWPAATHHMINSRDNVSGAPLDRSNGYLQVEESVEHTGSQVEHQPDGRQCDVPKRNISSYESESVLPGGMEETTVSIESGDNGMLTLSDEKDQLCSRNVKPAATQRWEEEACSFHLSSGQDCATNIAERESPSFDLGI